jgi:hypothetical protein
MKIDPNDGKVFGALGDALKSNPASALTHIVLANNNLKNAMP